ADGIHPGRHTSRAAGHRLGHRAVPSRRHLRGLADRETHHCRRHGALPCLVRRAASTRGARARAEHRPSLRADRRGGHAADRRDAVAGPGQAVLMKRRPPSPYGPERHPMTERLLSPSTFHVDPDRMLIDQPAAQIGRQGDQRRGDRREVERPVLHADGLVVIAQHPVERGQREHHHSQDRVAPGGDLQADLAHADQVDEPEYAGHPAAQRAHAGKPEAGTPPELIERPEIGQIDWQQPRQRGYRKMEQHRMQRMPANGRTTVDGVSILGHAALQWLKRPARTRSERGAGLFNGAVLGLAVPLLAACDGPQSALAPASPMASSVANVWWTMFGFSTLVLLVVSALWIYAMRRQPRETSPAEARRIHRRWLIGGGLVLPTASIVLLLAFGLPAGRSMLPLPGDQALRIEVTGHQWWWEVRYPESGVVTANQLILPVGR